MVRVTSRVTASRPPTPAPLISRPKTSTTATLATIGHSQSVEISRGLPLSKENLAIANPVSPTAKNATTRNPLTIRSGWRLSVSTATKSTIRPMMNVERNDSRVTSSRDTSTARHQTAIRKMTDTTNPTTIPRSPDANAPHREQPFPGIQRRHHQQRRNTQTQAHQSPQARRDVQGQQAGREGKSPDKRQQDQPEGKFSRRRLYHGADGGKDQVETASLHEDGGGGNGASAPDLAHAPTRRCRPKPRRPVPARWKPPALRQCVRRGPRLRRTTPTLGIL